MHTTCALPPLRPDTEGGGVSGRDTRAHCWPHVVSAGLCRSLRVQDANGHRSPALRLDTSPQPQSGLLDLSAGYW